MKKQRIRVKLVRYEMTKTKNRKRKDMLVDEHSEASVKLQLERIHKGEKVVSLNELHWDEEQIEQIAKAKDAANKKLLYGEVKFFDPEKGFGFIAPDDEEIEDLFFHKTTFSGEIPKDYDRVQFEISESPKGLCAIHIKIVDA